MSIFIFTIGALGYGLIETLFRGYTHWTMMLTGGACLLTLSYFNRQCKNMSVFLKAAGGAFIITVYEFAVGVIVNLWYGWNVWDYSMHTGNLLGQICPLFTFLWFLLCLGLILFSKSLSFAVQKIR